MKSLIVLLLLCLMTSCGKKDEVLLVTQAPHGEDSKNADGYELTLEEVHDTVLWFSSRPDGFR